MSFDLRHPPSFSLSQWLSVISGWQKQEQFPSFPFTSLSISQLERIMGGDFLSAFRPSQSFTFSLLCSLLIFLHFSIFTSFLSHSFNFFLVLYFSVSYLTPSLSSIIYLLFLFIPLFFSPLSSLLSPPSVGSNHPSPFSPFKVTLSVVCSFN